MKKKMEEYVSRAEVSRESGGLACRWCISESVDVEKAHKASSLSPAWFRSNLCIFGDVIPIF